MTLAELITALEAADPNRVVPHGFTNPHSYRGDYMDLAFEPASDVTVADMLADARSALGATYQGWKGGDFTMGEHTWCWLSQEGDASGETVSALLLQLMLAEVSAGTAAPAPPVAPLAASQPSEARGEGETTARASTGRTEDAGDAVVETDAIHLHFGLTYANYLVLPRTLLQSMDDEWQTGFVAHLDRLDEAFAHVPQAKGYKVEAATEHEVADLDDEQLAQLGITEDWYRGETPPEGLSPEDLAEWEAAHEDPEGPTYSRDGEELDRHQRVLIPCEDPVPHYNRGRTHVEPQPAV